MIKTESAGGVVVNSKGEIVLVRNGRGLPWWGFPKGHVDEGEEIISAAQREINEETGLTDLILIKKLATYSRFKGAPDGGEDKNELKNIHMFLFKTNQEFLAPIDPNNPEARWVPREEVLNLLTHLKDKEFFLSVTF